jgi:XTP/dITP diphosphohydrolase
MDRRLEEFQRLLDIMDELREKCPWDKKQTNESLRTLTIEETYELADAILDKDSDEVKKELGDLMLHLVFYAKIGEETGKFSIADVLFGINEKLIYRHPHIFGDVRLSTAREVEDNWEKVKLTEGVKKRVLGGVPKSLPATIKAYRMQDKARGVGFDWEKKSQVWDKVMEEYQELHEAINNENRDDIESEFGDLFFALINAARLYNINPENALERTNRKFLRRFNFLEEQTIMQGKSLKSMTLEEMDVFWNEAKSKGW